MIIYEKFIRIIKEVISLSKEKKRGEKKLVSMFLLFLVYKKSVGGGYFGPYMTAKQDFLQQHVKILVLFNVILFFSSMLENLCLVVISYPFVLSADFLLLFFFHFSIFISPQKIKME